MNLKVDWHHLPQAATDSERKSGFRQWIFRGGLRSFLPSGGKGTHSLERSLHKSPTRLGRLSELKGRCTAMSATVLIHMRRPADGRGRARRRSRKYCFSLFTATEI